MRHDPDAFGMDLDLWADRMVRYRITVLSHTTGGIITDAIGQLEQVLKDVDRLAAAREAHTSTVERPEQRWPDSLGSHVIPAGRMLRSYTAGVPLAGWHLPGELGL
jgi:hypothetical protein